MAISDRIDSIITHLENAYTKISSKGGTLPANKNMANLEDAIDSISVGSQVRLNAPSVVLETSTTTSDPMKITNTYNGNFVDSYDIYKGNDFLTNVVASLDYNRINLRDYIFEGGTYIIKVVAKGTGFLDSYQETITYTHHSYVTVTNTLTHCFNENTKTTVEFGDYYEAYLTAENGYTFVGASVSILMSGIDITDDVFNEGEIYIENITGAIEISAAYVPITQLLTPTIVLSNAGLLTITPVENAQSYDIYVNDGKWKNVTELNIDLAQYLVLMGTFDIYVKAVANGYEDSSASNQETYINSDGNVPDSVLDNNDWPTIALTCELGLALNYWNVGDTKADVGEDGSIRNFMIVDMQGLYNKHVVFQQVECENDLFRYNNPRNNYGALDNDGAANDYGVSGIRKIGLPTITLRYSAALQNALTPTTYLVAKNGTSQNAPLLKLTDKLFLPAQSEYYTGGGNPPYGFAPLSERQALTRYQYYANGGSGQKRRIDGTLPSSTQGENCWLMRSPCYDESEFVYCCKVTPSGDTFLFITRTQMNVRTTSMVAPCFSF